MQAFGSAVGGEAIQHLYDTMRYLIEQCVAKNGDFTSDSGFKKASPHSLAMMRTSVLSKKREVSRDQHLISEEGL